MGKIIDSLVQASIDSKDFAGVILCKLSFDSPTGDLRYCNAYQSVYWDEDGGGEVEYIGLGNLASLSVLNESSELQAQTIQVGISGVPNAALTDALSTGYMGNPIFIWYATLNKETYAVEGGQSGPVLIFAGLMDYASIEFGGDKVSITMNATSRLADWERPRGGRFNQSYQQTYIDATDTGFEYVQALQSKEVSWGAYSVLDSGKGSGGCFIAGTMIKMDDGSEKVIEKIEAGDKIKSSFKPQEVKKLVSYEHTGNLYSINGGNYFVTSSHPFRALEGWKAFDVSTAQNHNPDLVINELVVGDTIVVEGKTLEKVHSISAINTQSKVYNLSVGATNDYYADGYLVHNKLPKDYDDVV